MAFTLKQGLNNRTNHSKLGPAVNHKCTSMGKHIAEDWFVPIFQSKTTAKRIVKCNFKLLVFLETKEISGCHKQTHCI